MLKNRPELYLLGSGVVATLILFAFPTFGVFILVALCLLILGFVITIFNIRLLPYLIFMSLIIGQLIRLPLSKESSSALLMIDLTNGLYVILGLIYSFITRKKFPFTLATLFSIAFAGWIAITLLIGSHRLLADELLIAAFYTIRFLLMIGTFLVTAMLFETESAQDKQLNTLIKAGIIVVLLGYAQLIFIPNFTFMAQFGWDPHQGRFLSTFFDPNFMGIFLTFLFSILLAKLFFSSPQKQILISGLLLIILGAIVTTYSRSTYLAFLISLILILFIRSWRLVLVILLSLGFMSFAIPRVRERIKGAFKVDQTSQERIKSWKDTYYIIQKHPITGVGYNALGPAQIRYGIQDNLKRHSARGSDSSFLLVLATTGIIGLILYLLVWMSLWYESFVLYFLSPSSFYRSLGLAGIGIIPAYLIHSQFVNSLFYPLVFIPFAFVVAMLIAGTRKLRQK